MRLLALFILLAFGHVAQAQPEQLAAKTLRAVQRLILKNTSVDSIAKVISSASTHGQLATAKAVYDYVQASGGSTVSVTARLSGNGSSGTPLDIAQQSATTGQVLQWSGTAWVPATPTASKTYEEFDGVSGTTITTANTIPATEKNWRINLYRDGVRLRYLKDYSISGSVFTLYVSATSENFTLIIEN
jgi:hypothetical protein